MVNGVVTVTDESISVRGVSEIEDASAQMSRLFTSKLGERASFELDVAYREPPPPTDIPLSAEDCELRIGEILATKQITFEPGSATIDAGSLTIVAEIADVLDNCGAIPLEIQGHTDSQGRESMNLELSQDRADAVLDELRARRVRTATYRAMGYGEAEPIADNDTEDGREANRRIEFRLMRTDTSADDETTLDSLVAPLPDDNDTEAASEPGDTADPTPETEDPDNEQN